MDNEKDNGEPQRESRQNISWWPSPPKRDKRRVMPSTAIIFDLDGTLIHSAPDLHAAMNKTLVALGREELDLKTIIAFIGNGVEKLVARSLAATGPSTPELQHKTLIQFLEMYEARSLVQTRPYPGVITLLEKLRNKGIPLAICTNKPAKPARDICDALGLTVFFDVIVGADPDRLKKPDPASLLTCISALGSTPAEALYIGDSAVDGLTARNAIVPFVFFEGGYLNEPLPEPGPIHRFANWSDHVLFKLCCYGSNGSG